MRALRVPLIVVGVIVGAFGLGYLVAARLWDEIVGREAILEAGRG